MTLREWHKRAGRGQAKDQVRGRPADSHLKKRAGQGEVDMQMRADLWQIAEQEGTVEVYKRKMEEQ
jgi:hypothetical protein